MKKYAYTIVLLLAMTAVTANAQTRVLAASTATTTQTKGSEEICILSNGGTIPCVWKADAENSLTQKTDVYHDSRINKDFCKSNKGAMVECKYVDKNGDTSFWFNIINQINKTIRNQTVLYVALGTIFIIVLLFVSTKLYKKHE